MKLHKYSEEQLIEAIKTSSSMRKTLQKLDVAAYGGNYDVLRKAIKHFKLDTSHYTGQALNKGGKLPPRRLTEQYLKNELPIQSFKL